MTVTDADAARVVNALQAASQLQPGAGPPQFPVATGATNAATIKSWVIQALQQATMLHEGTPSGGVVPAIT
ncbi:MAG: hypothetical protein V4472_25095 [Pseudomonadota bacterium]